jgi:signal transduction histidine kinase
VYLRDPDTGWVEAGGRPVDAPAAGPGRAVTSVMRRSRPIAAISHDAELLAEPVLLQAATAAVALALDNERLTAVTLAQLDEVLASRARLVTAGDAARRRMQRDLQARVQRHLDGLPGRLRDLAGAPAVQVRATVAEAAGDTQRAIDELRELAHGIFPVVLVEEGLAAAVEVLAEHSDVPVEIGSLEVERLAPAVEAAAYFAIAESIRGATGKAVVDVVRDGGLLVIRIGYDNGGAESFTEIDDRLGAVDGRLYVRHDEDTATTIRVEIPCAS